MQSNMWLHSYLWCDRIIGIEKMTEVIGMKKNDWLLIIIILLTSISIFGMRIAMKDQGKSYVTVRINGEIIETYELDEDQEVRINGGSNVMVIKNGQVDMIEADCPDKLCVNQTAIFNNNESIVCLPNRVVVQVVSYNEAEYDALTN